MAKKVPGPLALRAWRVDTNRQLPADVTFTVDADGRVRLTVTDSPKGSRPRTYDLQPEIRDLALLLRWAQAARP